MQEVIRHFLFLLIEKRKYFHTNPCYHSYIYMWHCFFNITFYSANMKCIVYHWNVRSLFLSIYINDAANKNEFPSKFVAHFPLSVNWNESRIHFRFRKFNMNIVYRSLAASKFIAEVVISFQNKLKDLWKLRVNIITKI